LAFAASQKQQANNRRAKKKEIAAHLQRPPRLL
jgi:hypothetical protein